MNNPIITTASNKNAEIGALASEMARAFGHLVEGYEKQWKLSRDEALTRVDQWTERILASPPEQVGWAELHILAKQSPALAYQRWQDVLKAARAERQSGHRAALAVEMSANTCWKRARFLALRAELHEGWQPRNSVEGMLLDILAQAQHEYETWLEVLTERTQLQRTPQKQLDEDDPRWIPPRVDDAEAVEQAGAMVDRFHRMLMRTIRTLQSLRRHAPVVMVQNASQVNVGGQQINGVSS